MRLLILSYFFPPDLSAGSFRTSALVDALAKLEINRLEIIIITTQPNRYRSISRDAKSFEDLGQIKIFRTQVVKNSGNFFSQAMAFIKYAIEVRRLTKDKKYDLIYATSSRLMTASLGAYISIKSRTPLYLDIRDIFADTFKDINFFGLNNLIAPFFSFLERWTLSTAFNVNLVSPGFGSYFTERYPDQSFSFFMNGVDETFIEYANKSDFLLPSEKAVNSKLSILYAGNIGEGQGLEKIVPDLASRLGEMVTIRLIGDGSKKGALLSALKNLKIENVIVSNPMNRLELLKEYEQADILFLHLNSYPAFEKVIPSKVFEYAALGKPILAGVAGFAKDFIEAEIDNAEVFQPCDIESALIALNKLRLERTSRAQFLKKYRRICIMDKMARDILRYQKI